MAAELKTGIQQRLGNWRSALWQIYEAQYEPFSVAGLQRHLRSILSVAHLAGLDIVVELCDQLSRNLAFPVPPDQETVEAAFSTILSGLETLSEDIEDPESMQAFIIHVRPGQDFLDSSLDISMVFAELAQLGHLEIMPDIDACPIWEQFDAARCTIKWDLLLISGAGIDRIRDCLDFLGSEPGMQISVEENASPIQLQQVRLRTRVAPIPENPVPTPANPAGYQRRASDREAVRGGEGGGSIRMAIERLDKIINSVGELVTAQVRLKAVSQRLSDNGLEASAEEIERLTIILRDASMGLRLQAVGALFSRFNRLVRDLSQTLHKEVDFTTIGEETELDRTVIEKLYDPLVHIIRNSLDHGIESQEERQRNGKPIRGSITLRAYQQGSEVIIQVVDDGGGINAQKVLAKAIEKGLIRPDVQLDRHQIHDLLFLPGFSTASTVSDVSGRGVGMDVVKSNVEALRGQVTIESEQGVGTTMSLHFPLTMAIIDGLCVEIGNEKYIIPLDPVEECLDLGREASGQALLAELAAGKQGLYYNLRGDGVSLFSLSSVLCPSSGPGRQMIIMRGLRGDRIALLVDTIVGRQQVVIKPLGPLHIMRKELSGATIMGDGTIALVLDMANIIRRLTSENMSGKNIALS